jgi:superfamily II DNA/RNA helicase
MPSELNDLIHRIGRTARGGQSGTVCILQCGKTDPVFAAYCQKEHPEIEEFQWNPR